MTGEIRNRCGTLTLTTEMQMDSDIDILPLLYVSEGQLMMLLIPFPVDCVSVLVGSAVSRGLQPGPAASSGHQLFLSGPWLLRERLAPLSRTGRGGPPAVTGRPNIGRGQIRVGARARAV